MLDHVPLQYSTYIQGRRSQREHLVVIPEWWIWNSQHIWHSVNKHRRILYILNLYPDFNLCSFVTTILISMPRVRLSVNCRACRSSGVLIDWSKRIWWWWWWSVHLPVRPPAYLSAPASLWVWPLVPVCSSTRLSVFRDGHSRVCLSVCQYILVCLSVRLVS